MVAQAITAPSELMTAEEFYDWVHLPENADYSWELEDGKVVRIMSRPTRMHGLICWLTIAVLTDYIRKRNAGYILTNDTGFVVKRRPDSVRGPDVMLFLKSQYQSVDDVESKYVDNIPDLIVEVFSTNDRPGKLNKRIQQYLAKGVPLVWVVYPEEHTVDVFKPGRSVETFEVTETLEGGKALPGLKLPVADLFKLPGTPAQE